MANEPIQIDRARAKRELRTTADAILKELKAPSAAQLAAAVGTTPFEIQQAIIDAAERAQMYRDIDAQHAAQDEAEGIPGDCCRNLVCPSIARHMISLDEPPPRRAPPPTCSQGVAHAQGCMFRMVEAPPSDPFTRLPSHGEAIRMLQRAGLVATDDFGKHNGTNFAQRLATNRLWFAFIDLLVKVGRLSERDVDAAMRIFEEEYLKLQTEEHAP